MALWKPRGYLPVMVKSLMPNQGVSGWRFTLEEVSNGHWRAEGRHDDGRSVSREGSEEMALLAECVEDARGPSERRHA